jgi:hypothetical protein
MALSCLGVFHIVKMQKSLTANNFLLTRATPESIAVNNSKRANFSSSYAAGAADLLAPSVNESVFMQGEYDAINNATFDVDTSTARSTPSSNDGTKTNTNDDLLDSPLSINAGSVATDNTENEDERITCVFLNLNAQSSNETDSEITCVDSVGIDGQWVYKPNRTFFSGSTCCGWDEFPTRVMNEKNCRQTMTTPTTILEERESFINRWEGMHVLVLLKSSTMNMFGNPQCFLKILLMPLKHVKSLEIGLS